MEWLSENWAWILIGAAFIAMHMFGHGGHGGHGGQSGRRRTKDIPGESAEQRDEEAPPPHRH